MKRNNLLKSIIFLSDTSSEVPSKSCWDYGSKLENPYSKLESSYGKLESPYSKLESTYSKLDSPYSKLENPYSKLESHYSKLESPYSKLESHYTSSLASQHFNNIKMDPQQGKYFLTSSECELFHTSLSSPRDKILHLLWPRSNKAEGNFGSKPDKMSSVAIFILGYSSLGEYELVKHTVGSI